MPRPVLKPAIAASVSETPKPFPQVNRQWPADIVEAERQRCNSMLKGLTLSYEPLPPIGVEGGCGAPAPILLRSIAGAAIDPPAETTCDLAVALHGWVTSSLQPAAQQLLKTEVAVIQNASAYVCRRRNGQSTGKLSEHAKANAMDIARIGFTGGASTDIKGDWLGLMGSLGLSQKSAFLARIRRDACIRFTTVLGPGSDSFHKDHFHVDVVKRRGGYRICQ